MVSFNLMTVLKIMIEQNHTLEAGGVLKVFLNSMPIKKTPKRYWVSLLWSVILTYVPPVISLACCKNVESSPNTQESIATLFFWAANMEFMTAMYWDLPSGEPEVVSLGLFQFWVRVTVRSWFSRCLGGRNEAWWM